MEEGVASQLSFLAKCITYAGEADASYKVPVPYTICSISHSSLATLSLEFSC